MRALAAIASVLIASAFSPALAGPGEGIPVPYSLVDAQAGAQLRAEASIVIPIVFNPCGSSPAMEPTKERFRAFVAGLSELRQTMDIAIARVDFDYQMSLVDLLCPNRALPEYLESEKLEIAVANSVLDRMDRLVKPVSGQDK
ncbi:MAG: hypothetical protein ABJ205_05085 [Erythrobacter sp.]|uniref:hypothetical protein n=1 Tax=Erythrobacter sp. TaxID=1042 RepID=UPI003262F3DD